MYGFRGGRPHSVQDSGQQPSRIRRTEIDGEAFDTVFAYETSPTGGVWRVLQAHDGPPRVRFLSGRRREQPSVLLRESE